MGDYAQGGVVFWVNPSGEHGKVVSIYDVAGVVWSNVGSPTIGTSAQSDINGAGNTVAIMMQSGHIRSAAQHCADLAYGDYDDWYLPAKDELDEVYQNKAAINTTAVANGGEDFTDFGYWSSTESGISAWGQFFNNGFQAVFAKIDSGGTQRAIRAF